MKATRWCCEVARFLLLGARGGAVCSALALKRSARYRLFEWKEQIGMILYNGPPTTIEGRKDLFD